MHKMDPVDELAEVRVEIARLQLRAAKLRGLILAAPEAAQGRWHRAEVTQTHRMVFDISLLPVSVRDNPLYWQERITQVVKCVAVHTGPQPRPGWPIRREVGVGLH
jgi:hypothetical protein